MLDFVLIAFKFVLCLLVIAGVLVTLGLCKAASERDRAEEEAARPTKKYQEPRCYTPNDNPYPLCKGDGSEECQYCCLYEHFPEPPFDK